MDHRRPRKTDAASDGCLRSRIAPRSPPPTPDRWPILRGTKQLVAMAPRGKVALFVCPSTPFFLDALGFCHGDLKESAQKSYGLGCTTWEVMWNVVLPYTKTGVVGGVMLGLGRALGETMAVTFVIGNMNQLGSLSLFEAANSITSALANEFAEAGEGLHQASLIYLGLILFFITFVVLSLSKVLLSRLQRGEGART